MPGGAREWNRVSFFASKASLSLMATISVSMRATISASVVMGQPSNGTSISGVAPAPGAGWLRTGLCGGAPSVAAWNGAGSVRGVTGLRLAEFASTHTATSVLSGG